jgi:thiol-disulfide isomerase/thioredoxin
MNGTREPERPNRCFASDRKRCRGVLVFLCAIFSTIIVVEGEQPAVSVGRITLNSDDKHEWLDLFGIEANEFPVMVSGSAYGARLRIDVWEPGDKDKPTYSRTFGPNFTFKKKGPFACNWKVSFLPPKLENVVPKGSYPAVLDWRVTGPGDAAENNHPVTWLGRERIDLPRNYLGIEGYTLDISPAVFNADSFNQPVPIFHYMVSDDYGRQSKQSSAETLKANPRAVHIIGWLVPQLERSGFGESRSETTPPPTKTDPPIAENRLLPLGSPAPEWTATKVNGGVLGSGDLKGKIVVLNFWATWCGHCVAEMPEFVQVQGRYRGQGVEFVGMCMDRQISQEGVARFLQWHFPEAPLNYPTVMLSEEVERKFGRIEALPTTYLLDRKGNVAWGRQGEASGEELSTQIQKLIGK